MRAGSSCSHEDEIILVINGAPAVLPGRRLRERSRRHGGPVVAAAGRRRRGVAVERVRPRRRGDAAVGGRNYFPPLTPPLANRATYRYELGRNAWALEQLLVFSNVSALRTIVIKLEDGSLWVDGPQWPTGEFCALLDELGPVGHVVLPCVALEHKAPMQAFTKVPVGERLGGGAGPSGDRPGRGVVQDAYRVDGVFPVGAPKEGSTRCRPGRTSSTCAPST